MGLHEEVMADFNVSLSTDRTLVRNFVLRADSYQSLHRYDESILHSCDYLRYDVEDGIYLSGIRLPTCGGKSLLVPSKSSFGWRKACRTSIEKVLHGSEKLNSENSKSLCGFDIK